MKTLVVIGGGIVVFVLLLMFGLDPAYAVLAGCVVPAVNWVLLTK